MKRRRIIVLQVGGTDPGLAAQPSRIPSGRIASMTSARNIIALDATAELCSVAWTDGSRWIERAEFAGQRHSALMLAMVEDVLREARQPLRAVDEIAFGAGPGSFTGLRIACGIAQGLGLGAQRPVRAVSSLLALAQASGSDAVIAALDARMNEVYWAAYRRARAGAVWTVLAEPAVMAPDAVDAPDGAAWTGAGSGFAAYPALARRLFGPNGVSASIAVTARAIGELALSGHGMLGPAETASPHYVRDKVARTTAERASS